MGRIVSLSREEQAVRDMLLACKPKAPHQEVLDDLRARKKLARAHEINFRLGQLIRARRQVRQLQPIAQKEGSYV